MKYVEDMNSEELRAHVRMLQASPGWYDHFADRLIKEIREQDKKIAELETRVSNYTWDSERLARQTAESDRYSWK